MIRYHPESHLANKLKNGTATFHVSEVFVGISTVPNKTELITSILEIKKYFRTLKLKRIYVNANPKVKPITTNLLACIKYFALNLWGVVELLMGEFS